MAYQPDTPLYSLYLTLFFVDRYFLRVTVLLAVVLFASLDGLCCLSLNCMYISYWFRLTIKMAEFELKNRGKMPPWAYEREREWLIYRLSSKIPSHFLIINSCFLTHILSYPHRTQLIFWAKPVSPLFGTGRPIHLIYWAKHPPPHLSSCPSALILWAILPLISWDGLLPTQFLSYPPSHSVFEPTVC